MSDLVRVPKYSHFTVHRVGQELAFQCIVDYEQVGGHSIDLTWHFETLALAKTVEAMLNHFATCSELCGEIPDDVLQQTLLLMKGKDS